MARCRVLGNRLPNASDYIGCNYQRQRCESNRRAQQSMSYTKRMQRSKSVTACHRGRHRKKRNSCAGGNSKDRLFEFHHGSILTRND
jgi:hypothetical protein